MKTKNEIFERELKRRLILRSINVTITVGRPYHVKNYIKTVKLLLEN